MWKDGTRDDENYIHCLLFADDQIILTEDRDNVIYMKTGIGVWGKWGLEIN